MKNLGFLLCLFITMGCVLFIFKLLTEKAYEGFRENCVIDNVPNDSRCNAGEICYMIGKNNIENGCKSINSIQSGYCNRNDACLSGICDLRNKACDPQVLLEKGDFFPKSLAKTECPLPF